MGRGRSTLNKVSDLKRFLGRNWKDDLTRSGGRRHGVVLGVEGSCIVGNVI